MSESFSIWDLALAAIAGGAFGAYFGYWRGFRKCLQIANLAITGEK